MRRALLTLSPCGRGWLAAFAARRVKGSLRKRSLHEFAETYPVIRRFAPPSPTRGEGGKRAPAPCVGTLCPLLVLDRGHQRCSAQKSCWSTAPRVDLRRITPRHALQIRPPDRSWPADHPAAAGAAYAHADPELFAQGHSGQPFRELAAGSAGQLARALRLPGEDDRAQDRGRFHGADDHGQSVRLLRRALCRQLSVRIYARSQDRARALSRDRQARSAVREISRHDPARSPEHRQLPGRSQQRSCRRRSATSSAWSRACRRRRRRSPPRPARAATPPGF